MHCQVLSCPPFLISSDGYSQNTAHNFQQTFPAFISTGRKKKSTNYKFLSTKFEQPAIFDSALDWQQVQLTALPPTHRLNPHKSQLTGLSLRGCSYVILVLFLKLCKGQESQTIQSAQDFFLVQFTNILSILAFQDPNITFIR